MSLFNRKFFINKPIKILLATNGLIMFAGAMLGPIYAIFVERIGGDLLDASLTGGFFALAAGLTSLISGKYADKIRENEMIIVYGYLLIGISFFMFIFVSSIYMLFVLQVIIGFAEAMYSPAFDAIYSKNLKKRNEGKGWGAWESLNYFTAAGGAFIGGLIASYFGFDVLFVAMSVLTIVSGLYILFLPRKML